MSFINTNYYYVIVGLQALCVFHSFRRGTQGRWLFVIVLLPVVGCLAYIYSEILANRRVKTPNIDLAAVFNPGARIKRLEDALRFSDTFNNKIRLADAYLEAGYNNRAIAVYEPALTGAFAENEHGLSQLVIAYFNEERYDDAIRAAKKVYRASQFNRSKAHIIYAQALERNGQPDLAEKEFKAMKGRYSCFEHRYHYGEFLKRAGRHGDAQQVFGEMMDEAPHLGAVEKKTSRVWINKAKEELKKMEA
ncbi:hypothetical protein [Hufsiella ginkgonis]|uniref:Cardiolipin synthase N-terminal domain-containing protein n=1 Tax=Hufsiella ginkgonis TaxID=2695274 RepID=A0A7K1XTB5_9SPHI|nr:hypothetical protein [Hufsiella ginkgonis]MXV14253.1 hypothetical protein [Hufsiella ginkgonis]